MASTKERTIWDFLMSKVNNAYGVAALMGNLYVESHLDPGYLESSVAKKLGFTTSQYISIINNGTYPMDKFIGDGAGFGLAQWTNKSRKQALYEYAKSQGKPIEDLQMQLEYLWIEIQKYAKSINAIRTATNVRWASDIIVKDYEKPKNQTEKFLQNRANYGQGYYDVYAKNQTLVTATANVNLRLGNDKSYEKVGLLKTGSSLPYIAESENEWYAVKWNKQVVWLDSQFAELKK